MSIFFLSIINKDFPLAKYFHCAAHKLNLCVVKSCTLTSVRKMMDTLGEISRFFSYSPKRQALLAEMIKSISPEEKKSKLKDVCKTRWVERIDALSVTQDLFHPLAATLSAISNNEGRGGTEILFLKQTVYTTD